MSTGSDAYIKHFLSDRRISAIEVEPTSIVIRLLLKSEAMDCAISEVGLSAWVHIQAALLRKSAFVLTVAFPVAVQATASISALARAEKRFMNEPCRAIGPSDNGE
ncbi:hypothetical protein JMM60_17650 [Rhodovulum sulfidophilum]|uniref:Uncharacterized protein n=1 Tax=Rhodovulum sulfidophilum TaxID=35806 RepID=A0ABS1RWY0_RHOSU|nr:hypothetical protein [Rhodovulum sulfidophilum]